MTPEQRYKCMSSVHSANTGPEMRLRKAIWRLGFRYRINDRRLPGSPDIVLPKHRTVIFVHGCFWHGHKGCRHYTVPKTNVDFWTAKIARNQERDQEVWRQLEAKGWAVIIVWECELKKTRFEETIYRVKREILANSEAYRKQKEDRRHQREQRRIEFQEQKARQLLLMAEIKESHKG